MAIAVVYVKGPPERLVYINDGEVAEGRTNKHYPVEEGPNTFELKKSPRGPAYSLTENIVAKDPPMEVDLTPPL
ncbi:MAG: hypothetical protein O7I42_11875 [Alphaproteobacteria bacterium]|nr:hypothetical protein [Alphaproteobacteria bacterium]